MPTVKTVIVDPQLMFVQGLQAHLNIQKELDVDVLATLTDGGNIRQELSKFPEVDLLIMELNLKGEDGLELIPMVRKYFQDLKILICTSYDDYRYVKEALINGADGYILKSNSLEHLMQGIVDVLDNNRYIAPGLHITPPNHKKVSKDAVQPKNRFEDRFIIKRKLTKREHEVLSLIAQAKNNKEIAEQLFISDQTVCVHRKNIMRKLGVRNTVNLIKMALEHQLVQY